MKTPSSPRNEAERLSALQNLALLDTQAEPRFDRVTRIARQHFSVPIALISLVDKERQWFKSKQGLDVCETPRDISFCGYAILQEETLQIPNALEDERFHDNPLVTGPPNIRFYAGAPIHAPNRQRIGTLCIISDEPRILSQDQLILLRDLADIVEAEAARDEILAAKAKLEKNKASLTNFSQRLAVATRAGGIGVWDYNIQTNELDWDDRMFELYGITREQFPGAFEAWSHALHPEDKARAESELIGAIEGGCEFDTEFRVRWPNDEIRYLQASATVIRDPRGKALKMIGVNQDITERKKMELTYKLHDAIVQSSDQAIISITLDGTITSWNCGAEKVFGFMTEQVLGLPILLLIPENRQFEGRKVLALVTQGEILQNYDTVCQRADGTEIDTSVALSPIVDTEGEVVGASIIARDITESKKLERLKSEFVSTVSHELRTPLTSIRGALGLIFGKYSSELSAKTLNLLEVANRNSERLSLLVNDILDLEKIDSGSVDFQFCDMDVERFIQRAIEENQGFADQHQVYLHFDSIGSGLQIRGDENRLMQVMANLLSNGIKFSPPGEKLIIKLEEFDHHIRIGVIDTGPGIPEEFRSQIFQRFAQADSSDARKKGGTGLGLSISKAIIERHYGSLEYDSEVGRGSEFSVKLPKLSPNKYVTSQRPRLLICEHKPYITSMLKTAAELIPVHMDMVSTTIEAEQKIAAFPYDLLLLDLDLPDVDGLEFLQSLRSKFGGGQLPIIVISSCANECHLGHHCGAMVVEDWLQKPFNSQRLYATLQSTFAKILSAQYVTR